MKLTLDQVRLGHATNSSSSHSLIFLKNIDDAPPYVNHQYGWDEFTLASRAAKEDYVDTILRMSLEAANMPWPYQEAVLSQWASNVPDEDDEWYIDHQSAVYLPYEFGTKLPSKEFYEDIREYLLQEGLVILGGNDNSGEHYLAADGSQFYLGSYIQNNYDNSVVCRKDGDWWTLFDRSSGNKLRFRLEDGKEPIQAGLLKVGAPELVDMSITSICYAGCKFCYMGSTPHGEHADFRDIHEIIRTLAKHKVFEIALGGGEPTLHPDFLSICKYAKEAGINANFTTRNNDFIARYNNEIFDYASAFAYSVDDSRQLMDFLKIVNMYDLPAHKINVHIVMGLNGKWEFRGMLARCKDAGIRPTLLGYKNTGRGPSVTPQEHDWWIDAVKDNEMHVSIDTVLASQYQSQLRADGVPSYLYHTEEGKFSCYVDAVNLRVGKSSFVPQSEMKDIDPHGVIEGYRSL